MKIRKSTWFLLLTFVFIIVALGVFELRKAQILKTRRRLTYRRYCRTGLQIV